MSTLKEDDSEASKREKEQDNLEELAMIEELDRISKNEGLVSIDMDDLQQKKRSFSIREAIQRDLSFLLGDNDEEITENHYGTQEV